MAQISGFPDFHLLISMPDKEFLILGKGLSGCALAMNLAMAGRTFSVHYAAAKEAASEKAAGLMNPVTGRRMALTWNYGNIWPEAIRFYERSYEFLYGKKGSFLEERSIRKALFSREEMNFLEAKSAWAGFGEIVRISSRKEGDPDLFHDAAGWAEIKNGHWLDAPVFLRECHNFFSAQGLLSESEFRKEGLQKLPDGWFFEGKSYRYVVSCLGLGCPWIARDLWPVKGQLFVLEALPDWGADVLKTAAFFIPLGGGKILSGSTYEREFDHMDPDLAGFESIIDGLHPELRSAIRICGSRSGLRPTSKDRRPHILRLDEGLFAINGLGTKGVSLAPWASAELLRLPEFSQESTH